MKKHTLIQSLMCLFLFLFISSCSSDKQEPKDDVVINDAINGLTLLVEQYSYLENGLPIAFSVASEIDELVVFPPDLNVKTYVYQETTGEWVEVMNRPIQIVTIDEYRGLQKGGMLSGDAYPIIEDINQSVRLRITVTGYIYRGSMETFDENGVTDERVTGSLEVILKAAEPTPGWETYGG
ncbi:MAG: hypothetical protein AAGU05_07720 [Anaerolineaceae bacterium]